MTRYLFLLTTFLLSTNTFSQASLSDYSYVIVPEQFEFLRRNDQFQINSMTKFYFEKSGFNAYFNGQAPNANRCEGLYANVEELKSIFGTKLQVVLTDCNGVEVYRSEVGKSKYKEYDKTYQDALRKAFESIEALRVKQKDVVLLGDAMVSNNNVKKDPLKNRPNQKDVGAVVKPSVSNASENILPDGKFSNYSQNGKTYLLRKTAEGYSLYEESSTAEDGLLLKGKIVSMDTVVKYIDTSGNVFDAVFDASENLTIKSESSTMVYKAEN